MNKKKGARERNRNKNLEELGLPISKLKFCPEQLRNLNYLFRNRLLHEDDNEEKEKSLYLAYSVTERLIQRLVCGVGLLDKRFSSKFLISLNDSGVKEKYVLNYYFRIDGLSTPKLYAADAAPQYALEETTEYPYGHIKIRLKSSTYKKWAEFTNNQGYLRRDKIQAKFVALLAQVASSDEPCSPFQIDESILCGSPSKIVDPYTLSRILEIPPEEQVFYGPGGKVPRFPDPRDFRLAIVDEKEGIRLRVEFLSPALSSIALEVRILVAIGVDAWPSSTDFPFRVPLGHTDYLLYQRCSKLGFYLVSYGIDATAWQIRFPASDSVLLNNYSENSTIKSIFKCLCNIVNDIQFDTVQIKRNNLNYNVLNSLILKHVLFHKLEKDNSNPLTNLINWSPKYLSTQVLKILDELVDALTKQNYLHYFFPKVNLLSNVGHLCEEDYLVESNKLQTYLVRLFDESLMSTRNNPDFKKLMSFEDLEMVLLNKWNDLVDGLLPPMSTRGRRFCFSSSNVRKDGFYSQYTERQLEYIGLLLKTMLVVKQRILKEHVVSTTSTEETILQSTSTHYDAIEDIVYILATIMEQARDQYIKSIPKSQNTDKIKSKTKANFDMSTTKLLDLVRKEKNLNDSKLQEDDTLVKIILKWLYKGMDNNKKYLAPVLRPYLNSLFNTSYVISWHIDYLKEESKMDELESLGAFSRIVNEENSTPAQALVDGYYKNWNWAKNMLKLLEETQLRVFFVPERGKVFRHILSLPSRTSKKEDDKDKIERARSLSLPSRKFFGTLLKHIENDNSEECKPQHCILKEASPLTLICNTFHRRGEHRCAGDVIQSLLHMQKLNIVQEVSSILSDEDRLELLETVQKIQSEKSKKKLSKRWSNTLPQSSSKSCTTLHRLDKEIMQKYTRTEESAGIRIPEFFNKKHIKEFGSLKDTSLIGSCRAARLRDDQVSIFQLQETFKKRGVKAKESFKK